MYSRVIKYWLVLGCVLLFFQVIIGGITRITGSGLSITKWEIVTGTLPPMNAEDWQVEFDAYKVTPQYQKLNVGMTMPEFKFIYFWEYFHRLWARMMGFIFLIPAVFFTINKRLDRPLWSKLIPVISFAVLAAIFGWIMVASGLIDRPWVNAYKLSIHLSIAAITFAFLVRATAYAFNPIAVKSRLPKLVLAIGIFLGVQIFLGGIMSGMKAGLYYPTWPDMYGQVVPDILTDSAAWTMSNLEFYDKSPFAPALIQALHRVVAYALFIMVIIQFFKVKQEEFTIKVQKIYTVFLVLVLCQVVVGILTVINCVGHIPLILGVMHQGIALLIVGAFVLFLYEARRT